MVCDFCLWNLLFYVTKELPEESGAFIYIFLFSTNGNYCNMFYLEDWYSTINATLMIQFSPSIQYFLRIFLCYSIMAILLTFIIRRRLIMWYLLWSTIIIGGTWCFSRTQIVFWIFLTRAVWLMLYKYPQKRKQLQNLRKTLNAWYIWIFVLLIYLWKKMSLPIYENFLLNADLVPKFWNQKSYNGYFFPGWLLLL